MLGVVGWGVGWGVGWCVGEENIKTCENEVDLRLSC